MEPSDSVAGFDLGFSLPDPEDVESALGQVWLELDRQQGQLRGLLTGKFGRVSGVLADQRNAIENHLKDRFLAVHDELERQRDTIRNVHLDAVSSARQIMAVNGITPDTRSQRVVPTVAAEARRVATDTGVATRPGVVRDHATPGIISSRPITLPRQDWYCLWRDRATLGCARLTRTQLLAMLRQGWRIAAGPLRTQQECSDTCVAALSRLRDRS